MRSGCPAALALDILGDRWTLLLIRDLLRGKSRYAEFQESPEKISTNILAARLKRLMGFGIVERRLYQTRPNRYAYRLTRKGADLIPVLQAVVAWSGKHLKDCWNPPAGFMDLTPERWWELQEKKTESDRNHVEIALPPVLE